MITLLVIFSIDGIVYVSVGCTCRITTLFYEIELHVRRQQSQVCNESCSKSDDPFAFFRLHRELALDSTTSSQTVCQTNDCLGDGNSEKSNVSVTFLSV